jgi:ribosomal protein S18 acetylase RimI-like enzyme
VIIRPAGRADLAALSALARQTYADAFGRSFSAADLAAHLERHLADGCFRQALEEDVFLLAATEERLIGFVQFGELRIAVPAPVPQAQELRRIYVQADRQGKGIGRQLLAAALEHPRLEAAPAIYLDVWEQNRGARRLYERHGFEVVGAHELATASGTAPDQDLIMVRLAHKGDDPGNNMPRRRVL